MERNDRLVRYFIYYVATLLFFGVGAITTVGLPWYDTLTLPSWTPPENLVALAWGILFMLTAVSAVRFMEAIGENRTRKDRRTIFLYMGNALLVLLWNYLFFGIHHLGAALVAASLVGVSAAMLMNRVRERSMAAANLLLPYLAWMLFALYFSYTVSVLN